MDIGIFFRGTTTPLVKASEFFYMFKNTKFDEFFYTEYNWELAYYTLIDKHDIRLEPDFLFDVNFLWDCANYPDTEFMIKNNPDKLFYELCPINLDHHIPKKANETYPNLKYLVSEITDEEDCIFDLSLVLNRFIYHKDWNTHYYLRDTFKYIADADKQYRMDYSVYLPFKPNRIKYLRWFYKRYKNLFYSVNTFHIKNIQQNDLLDKYDIDLHKQYERMADMYKEDLGFILNLPKENLIDDFYDGNGGLDYKINFRKFVNTTIKSDISILMETDNGDDGDMQKNLVTEKTYDLLAIGKPFIAMNKVTDDFLDKFGFINYKKIKQFKGKNELQIIDYICKLADGEYKKLKQELYELANENIKIFDNYIKKNTFIEKIVNGN